MRSRRLIRLRAAVGIAWRMLVLGVLIACAFALDGTRSLNAMLQAQGAWPWRWALLQKPVLWFALPLYVLCASGLGGATPALEPAGPVAKLLVVERALVNVVLSALGVVIFVGGWQLPAEVVLDASMARLSGAIYFVLQTWGFAWLLSLARRVGLEHELSGRALLLGCLATVALTGVWLWLDPGPDFELVVGRALGASLAIVALVTAIRARASSGPAPQESV